MTNAIELVETAYRFDVNDDEWLELVCTHTARIAPINKGVLGFEYRAAPGGAVPHRTHQEGCPAEVQRVLGAMMTHADLRTPIVTPGFICDYGHRVQGDTGRGLFQSSLAPLGISDVLGIKILDDIDRGLWIGINITHERDTSSEERRRWSYIGTHLAAAHRLRAQARINRSLEGADAILDPDGKLQHARDDDAVRAIDALRATAIKIDHARNGMRDDEKKALQLWEGLTQGRWSLLDTFDTDGRRFIVARRNAPQWSGPPRLTTAERQVVIAAASGHSNKMIGYQLGLPQSTVSTRLSSAMKKLGADSRIDLVKLVRSLLTSETSRATA